MASSIVDNINIFNIGPDLVYDMFTALGCQGPMRFYFVHPNEDMDYDIVKLVTFDNYVHFISIVWPRFWEDIFTIYVEIGEPSISIETRSTSQAMHGS